jgi:hypothetical protein
MVFLLILVNFWVSISGARFLGAISGLTQLAICVQVGKNQESPSLEKRVAATVERVSRVGISRMRVQSRGVCVAGI